MGGHGGRAGSREGANPTGDEEFRFLIDSQKNFIHRSSLAALIQKFYVVYCLEFFCLVFVIVKSKKNQKTVSQEDTSQVLEKECSLVEKFTIWFS